MSSKRNLDALPRRIACLGNGYTAPEFSHIAARTGASVTVLQCRERMRKAFDVDVVGWLMERFQALGIDVRTRTSVQAVEKINNGYRIHTSTDETKVTRNFFNFLANLPEDQLYWQARGSGSWVWRTDKFQPKARQAELRALEAIKHLEAQELWSARQKFRAIYGPSFPD